MADSAFPKLTDDLIRQVVDMEYITQSDFSWKRAPATAVLLAVAVLSVKERQPENVIAMAKEAIFHYGNWRNKDLPIAPSTRQEMYQRNYEGDAWEDYYHEDGF